MSQSLAFYRLLPRRAATCLWLVVTVSAGFASAEPDWTHYRGPANDGKSEWCDFSIPWPDSGPPVLWRIPAGEGYSSFVVVNSKVYTQVQNRAGQFVLCLDLFTGREIWRTRYGWPWEPNGQWPGPYASPTYHNGHVYFAGCHGTVGCMDAISGKLVWLRSLTADLGAELQGFGYACTPLVAKGKVYVPAMGQDLSLIALDALSGDVVWHAGNDPASYCSSLLISVENKPQIVTLLENALVARNPETGSELWRVPCTDGYNPHTSLPLYEEPYLFQGSAFRQGGRVLELTYANGVPSAGLKWKSTVLSCDVATGVIVDGYIYAFDIQSMQVEKKGRTRGVFMCIELTTGTERWQSEAPGNVQAIACGNTLVLVDEIGTLILTKVTPTNYVELARHPVLPGETCWTAPAIYDGYLLMRSVSNVACVFLGDPETLTASSRLASQSAEGSAEGRVARWLSRYQDDTFSAPAWVDLARWYSYTLFGVILPAVLISLLLRKTSFGAPRTFMLGAAVMGAVGTPLFTSLSGRFVFTLPMLLYLALALVVRFSLPTTGTSKKKRAILARLPLILFAAVCAGYYLLCRDLYVPSGWGFLVGFFPAAPLMWIAVQSEKRTRSCTRTYVLHALAFSIYFWGSTLVLHWRTG